MIYLVDSNFFIQAHRLYYPLDVFPSFWQKIKLLAESNVIISIDKVRNELYANNDDLTIWCKANLPTDFFKDTSTVISEYIQVTKWVESRNHYTRPALDEFLDADEADAWLVAYAKANNTPLVTHETSEPLRKSKVKIPDVCQPFAIRCLNTIELFRNLGETL